MQGKYSLIIALLVIAALSSGCIEDIYPDYSRAVFIDGTVSDGSATVPVKVILNQDRTGSYTFAGRGYTGIWDFIPASNEQRIVLQLIDSGGYPMGTATVSIYKNGEASVLWENRMALGRWYQD